MALIEDDGGGAGGGGAGVGAGGGGGGVFASFSTAVQVEFMAV